jgi:hypothetical protein
VVGERGLQGNVLQMRGPLRLIQSCTALLLRYHLTCTPASCLMLRHKKGPVSLVLAL